MADTENTEKTGGTTAPRRSGGPMGGGAGAAPVEKAKNFRQTLGRLLKLLCVDKLRVILMILLLIVSAGFSAYGPKALGNATNVLFNGLVSKTVTNTIECQLPPNMSLDQLKQQVDDPDGYLDIDKMMNMMQQQQAQASKVQTSENNAASASNSVENARPGCDITASAEGEFSGGADLNGIKDMLSSMQITLGSGVDFSLFAWTLLMVIGVYLATFILRWMGGWISVRIINNASKKLRQQIDEKIWKLPLSYFDKTSTGDVMSRTTNDLDNLTQTLNQTGGDFIFMALMVISVVVMMFTTSWLLAIIALVTIPISFMIVGIIMSKAGPQFKKQWATTGKLNGNVEESISGHALIKSYGKNDKFMAEFDRQNEELYKSSYKAQFISGTLMPVMNFMTNINYVIIALVGALKVASGEMSLGDVQAFIQYSRQYSQPLSQIAQSMNLLQSGAASAERIFELLDAEEELQEDDLPQEHNIEKGEITFEGVDFSYDPEQKLIENMNLVAKPGQTVAIVGPTGAGKTTLVNLIMRFYEIGKGKISVDGVDIHNISRQALRKNIGMVLQDTWLFKGTIKENLLYGVPEGREIDDITFENAVKATYVDHFVKSLKKGYDTVMGEDNEISVGEKQLLTIARAFLADPNILILDEATSSVDTRTEVLVQKAMNNLRANRTSFVIAHRLSTIRDADVIVVMDHGSIVEQGNHDALIAKGGRYAELYQSQFDGDEE